MAGELRFGVDVGADPRAVAFLEAKGLKRSWRWPSMWQAEHAYAFTLAGVHRLDVLSAAHELVTEAVAKGETLNDFRAAFEQRLKALGFSGPQVVDDFEEGRRKVNLSAPWRTRVIYDTNMRQAYAASEWQAIEDTAADFPALTYKHTPQQHPRLHHLAWDGITLPVQHVFWRTHYPQNAWFCKCWVLQVSVDQLASGAVRYSTPAELKKAGFSADPQDWPEWRHPKTGRVERAPEGIAPGFAYNAGQERRRNLGELLERRIGGMDPDLARAATADLVNFPPFADLVADAVELGQARAQAADAVLKRLRVASAAEKREAEAAVRGAEAAAGEWPVESWPVGVAPAEIRALAPDAGQVVVANASAIGHSANLHPTTAADWRRVQLLLEHGEVWRGERGQLVLFGAFRQGDVERTWTLALKPVAGAWRVRTLFESSPSRRRRTIARLQPVRAGKGVIELQGESGG